MRLFLYAMGGGMGHLTRALALAKVAIERGHDVRILTNSPYARRLRCYSYELLNVAEHLTVDTISAELDACEVRKSVLEHVAGRKWDALLVDTFPRGIGGELATVLPDVRAPKFLIHRDISQQYVTQANLREWANVYDRIFAPGERGALADLPNVTITEPWLICDQAELLSRAEARAVMGVTSKRPLILFLGSGKVTEEKAAAHLAVSSAREFADIAGSKKNHRPEICFASPSNLSLELCPSVKRVEYWPMMRLLPGVDLLVGAGGYNTVNEARATGTPLLAFAQKRLYDQQELRLRKEELVLASDELVERIKERLNGHRPQPTASTFKPNGVHQALEEIECCCLRKV